jgi:hypothetical protein
MDAPRILVLGSGPTGLGAAWQLAASGHTTWTLIDCERRAADSHACVVDHLGFLWDPGARPFLVGGTVFDDVVDRVLENGWADHVLGTDDVVALESFDGCGADAAARFRYPLLGGGGSFWWALQNHLPSRNILRETRVLSIDTDRQEVRFPGGEVEPYDVLISTLPLRRLVELIPDVPELRPRAGALPGATAHFVGIAVNGQTPVGLESRFFSALRDVDGSIDLVTMLSSLSPRCVPRPERQWSLQVELRESPDRRLDVGSIVNDTVNRLVEADILPEDASIANLWHDKLEDGIPLRSLDDPVEDLLAVLDVLGIASCGRLGAWDSALVDPDLLFLSGVEAATEALESISVTEQAPWLFESVGAATRVPWPDLDTHERFED